MAGKPRSFAASFWLGVITFGIYWLVYSYKVFKELDTHHGRDHKSAYFFVAIFVPVIGTVFGILYWAKEIGNVQEYRSLRGLPPGLTAATFLLVNIFLGWLVIPTIIMYHKLNKDIRETWWSIYDEAGIPIQQ